ncbi:MAG: hypothetical protein CMB75_05310 [Euryarchaeota archaeon]|nr:hypothetical protein [Euryarchaeota archaeon]
MKLPAIGHASCGGHVTLLFTVEDDFPEAYLQGSRGAGICLDIGCDVAVKGSTGNWGLDIRFEGHKGNADLVREIVEVVAEDLPGVKQKHWTVIIRNRLPPSQGFGMSAALAIATSRAIQRAMGEEYEIALRRSMLHAHVCERRTSSGLGDVLGISAGGVEIRTSPGSPFSGIGLQSGPGVSKGWSSPMEVILVWPDREGHHTSEYIDDPLWKKNITRSGDRLLSVLEGRWTEESWTELILCARSFVEESGLLEDSSRMDLLNIVEDLITESGEDAVASICLLGRSIIVTKGQLGSEVDFESLMDEIRKTGLECIKAGISDAKPHL